MGISKEQWDLFASQVKKGDTPACARQIAEISDEDYFDAHERKDKTLTRILNMRRFYISEQAMEVVHELATGSGGKKRSGAAVKVLEAYMPELFRRKMAHKIELPPGMAGGPAFLNPNLAIPQNASADIVDAEVVAIDDGRLPRKPGESPYDAVKALAKKNKVEDKAGVPPTWEEQGSDDEDDSATITAEQA